MKVKVGDIFYDSKELPIMVILSDKDKLNIGNMFRSATKYCQYNEENYTTEQISEWMDTDSICECDLVNEDCTCGCEPY